MKTTLESCLASVWEQLGTEGHLAGVVVSLADSCLRDKPNQNMFGVNAEATAAAAPTIVVNFCCRRQQHILPRNKKRVNIYRPNFHLANRLVFLLLLRQADVALMCR